MKETQAELHICFFIHDIHYIPRLKGQTVTNDHKKSRESLENIKICTNDFIFKCNTKFILNF